MSSSSSNNTLVDINSLQEAETRCRPFVHRTPLLEKSNMAQISGFKRIFWKAEIFQRSSTFKYRGAVNAVVKLAEQTPNVPLQLISHTSGNWGEALARAVEQARQALRRNDISAHIVIPKTKQNAKKINAIRRRGAAVHEVSSPAEREIVARKLLALYPDAHFIDQFQNSDVVSGHGVVGLELVEQLMNKMPDVLVVPMGGAALLAGVATAVRGAVQMSNGQLKPPLIIGAEAAAHGVAAESFQKGSIVVSEKANTQTSEALTDGLISHLSDSVFALIQKGVDGIVTVSDADIRQATLTLLDRLKIVVEPAAAVAAAVALFQRARLQAMFPGRPLDTCAVILSEGNLNLQFLQSHL